MDGMLCGLTSAFLHIPPGRASWRKGVEAVKKRSDSPDFVPENDDFAYSDAPQDGYADDTPDEYQDGCPDDYPDEQNWGDDGEPVQIEGQADMFAHEDFWNAPTDDLEALPEVEKVYSHSVVKSELKKPNFALSIVVNVICVFAILV